jgi:hypothetical protein
MSYKIFYFIVLNGICLISLAIFLITYLSVNVDKNKYINKNAVLFTGLGIFSWSIVAIYKIFDFKEFDLLYVLNDRILSSLSNFFILISLSYYPVPKDLKIFKIIYKKEVWFLYIFIFFIIIISFFTIFDKIFNSYNTIFRFIVVSIDALVSIFSIFLLGFYVKYTLKKYFINNLITNTYFILIVSLAITQVFLPLSKILPYFFKDLYPYIIALFLILSFGFIFSLQSFFVLVYSIADVSRANLSGSNELFLKIRVKTINKIVIGLNDEKEYFIELNLTLDNNISETLKINIGTKMLQSFSYWFVFMISKKSDVLLSHSEMSISKFRMVELLNKNSNFIFSQDIIFENDNGKYSLSIENNNIYFKNYNKLITKSLIKELFKKLSPCFVDLYFNYTKRDRFKTNKENIIEVSENVDILLEKILSY